jgi:hypothetical protein
MTHNYYDELTPAQREELAQIEAHAAEVKRIKEIGDAQETFDLDKLSRVKFTYGNDDVIPQSFRLKSKSKLQRRRPQIHYWRFR